MLRNCGESGDLCGRCGEVLVLPFSFSCSWVDRSPLPLDACANICCCMSCLASWLLLHLLLRALHLPITLPQYIYIHTYTPLCLASNGLHYISGLAKSFALCRILPLICVLHVTSCTHFTPPTLYSTYTVLNLLTVHLLLCTPPLSLCSTSFYVLHLFLCTPPLSMYSTSFSVLHLLLCTPPTTLYSIYCSVHLLPCTPPTTLSPPPALYTSYTVHLIPCTPSTTLYTYYTVHLLLCTPHVLSLIPLLFQFMSGHFKQLMIIHVILSYNPPIMPYNKHNCRGVERLFFKWYIHTSLSACALLSVNRLRRYLIPVQIRHHYFPWHQLPSTKC